MDPKVSNADDVIETISAEQANQLRNRGWFLLAIGKGHDDNGEACLTYSLGLKPAVSHPQDRPGSNDSPMDVAITNIAAQKAS